MTTPYIELATADSIKQTPQLKIMVARIDIYANEAQSGDKKVLLNSALGLLNEALYETRDFSVAAEALLERGICYRKLGLGDKALNDFTSVIRISTNNGLFKQRFKGWLEMTETLRTWDETGGQSKRLADAEITLNFAKELVRSEKGENLGDDLMLHFFIKSALLHHDQGRKHDEAALFLYAGDLFAKQDNEQSQAAAMYSLTIQICNKFPDEKKYQFLSKSAADRLKKLESPDLPVKAG